MRRLTGVAVTLLLAGAGSSLLGFSALIATFGARQAVRAAPLPLHPWGTAAGLIALPLGAICWRAAQRKLDLLSDDYFTNWRLREL